MIKSIVGGDKLNWPSWTDRWLNMKFQLYLCSTKMRYPSPVPKRFQETWEILIVCHAHWQLEGGEGQRLRQDGRLWGGNEDCQGKFLFTTSKLTAGLSFLKMSIVDSKKLPKALKIIFDRAIIFRSELKRERTRLPSWTRRRSSSRLSSTSQLRSLDTSHFRWKPLKGGSHSKKTSNQALFEFVSDTHPNNHGPKPGWTPTSEAVLNPDQFQILHNL